MSVSLAEIVARTLSGLGDPAPEVCSLDDAFSAVIQSLNVRTAQAKASDTNRILKKTKEFCPNKTDFDITHLIGSGTPIGLDFLENDNAAHYVACRICGIDALGDRRAAFYSEERADGSMRQFVRFASVPATRCRIYYDSDGYKTEARDQSSLPDSVSELVVLEAQNRLIPRIKLKYALNMNRNEQERKDAQLIMATYDGIFQQNMMNVPPLEQLWRIWAFRSDSPRRTKFNRFRSRNLYE